ncbi:MAG: RNA polymerase subunit sigma-24 [Nocardioidaceae bacterium]|nr:RNA polymerase subunit sigma-24 [Nocardioidaceae bacterium]
MSDLDGLLRELGPQVLGVLVRRGADFATAEDAVQEALLEAVRRWPDSAPDDPFAWLVTVAGHKLIDEQRSSIARERREVKAHREPPPGAVEQADDALLLLSRCCHPALSSASAVALTLRAVGGLTTAQIAAAFLVPESTMAQRISRAKRTVAGAGFGGFDTPGDVGAVLRVLYLIFNEGFTGSLDGSLDLAEEAIRLTRQLSAATDDPEIEGLLALMLLHHARRRARRSGAGELVPLSEQDRSQWDSAMIAEGVAVLQAALARGRLGEYQAQAAIAALHDDAATAQETDWSQIVSWYDDLLHLAPGQPVLLNRAVAVGAANGAAAGLRALTMVEDDVPRRDAAAAWLHEQAGDHTEAARLYAVAAARATSVAERNHLTRQSARLRTDR